MPEVVALREIVQTLKNQEGQLKEILEAIEQRDMSATQVKEMLKSIQQNLRKLRLKRPVG